MHTVDQVFMIVEQPGLLLRVNAVEAALTIGLCALGVAFDGIRGACLGPLVATTICTVYTVMVARLRHGFAIPLQPVLVFVVATVAMAATLLPDIYPAGPLGLALRVAAGGSVYCGLVGLALHRYLRAGLMSLA
jgi:hypothetical protein